MANLLRCRVISHLDHILLKRFSLRVCGKSKYNMTARSKPTHGVDPVQRMADQRILLDFIGKRIAIDVVTAGSSYNNVDTVLYSYIAQV